jgi:hypothetical protein
MNPANPYVTPASVAVAEPAVLSAFGELVKGWEKLRLLYCGGCFLSFVILGLFLIGVLLEPIPQGQEK